MFRASINSADLERVGRRLREIGSRELSRDLFRALNRASGPMREDAKASARATLPKRGGLADRVAKTRMSTRSRTRGRNVGVRIVGKGLPQVRRMDAGFVKHPLFGDRGTWVSQPVTPGWWSKPMQAGKPAARAELERVIRDLERKLRHM